MHSKYQTKYLRQEKPEYKADTYKMFLKTKITLYVCVSNKTVTSNPV